MSAHYDPEDRLLLETVASDLYREAVEAGFVDDSDERFADDEQRRAFVLLSEIGLLTLVEGDHHYVPVDPASVQSRVVVPLGQRGADLLGESARWAEAFGTLGQAYRKSPHIQDKTIIELRGLSHINSFLDAALDDCHTELLTAQPGGKRPEAVLADAIRRDIDALHRGVLMRTLYQHSARHSPATREYVAQVTTAGAEVRTLDEFFNRLIVIDTYVAVIHGGKPETAIAVHDPALITYLVDMFERSWERARPFTNNEVQTGREIAGEVRRMTIRMLGEGHSDAASAKRIGVSARTYAAYIASLKDEYGVQTRFQLGQAMAQEKPEELEPEFGEDF